MKIVSRMRIYDEFADVYDLAVSWDVGAEADWLIEVLGAPLKAVLEPGCGSGRLFPAFAARGVEVVGLDASRTMLRRAAQRMKGNGLKAPRTFLGDMAGFELGLLLDGAICPHYTFPYLATAEAARAHLACVARHLSAGRRYLLQFGLRGGSPYQPLGGDQVFQWEIERDGVRLRAAWGSSSYDPESRIEIQFSRFEFLSGPRKGVVIQESHRMRLWDWDEWSGLIRDSPFRHVGAYSGEPGQLPAPLPMGPGLNERHHAWHVLELRG